MKRFKFVSANLLIVVVLFVNAAIILSYPLSRIHPRLVPPLPTFVGELFNLYNIFSYHGLSNTDIEIYGIIEADASSSEPYYIKLNLEDYFPFRRGAMLLRAQIPRWDYDQSPAARHEALKSLVTKIRQRFNRMNPEMPIQKVQITSVTWPRSLENYGEHRTRDLMTRSTIFSE